MTPFERARQVVLASWQRLDLYRIGDDLRNFPDENLGVMADACEEAELHEDAAWFRWSLASYGERPPPGPFAFVGHSRQHLELLEFRMTFEEFLEAGEKVPESVRFLEGGEQVLRAFSPTSERGRFRVEYHRDVARFLISKDVYHRLFEHVADGNAPRIYGTVVRDPKLPRDTVIAFHHDGLPVPKSALALGSPRLR